MKRFLPYIWPLDWPDWTFTSSLRPCTIYSDEIASIFCRQAGFNFGRFGIDPFSTPGAL
jgi:hypothetical protein